MTNKIPVAEVQSMASEGKTEREIIHILKSQGYGNEQISKALGGALKSSVARPPMPAPPQPRQQQGTPSYALPPQPPLPTMSDMPKQDVNYGDGQQSIPMTIQEEIQLEELIEEMINERWESIQDSLVHWDKSLAVMEEQVHSIIERLEKLEEKHDNIRDDMKGILSSSSDHIEMIETRIGSVEKAFKEFLPNLTENIRSLSAVVENLDRRAPRKSVKK